MAPHADGLDVVVGAHSARNALPLFVAKGFRAKSFRPPSEGESLSLEWPRESNQREGHPASALSGRPARKVRDSGPGFSNGHPVRAKRRCHPWQRPLRGLSAPPRRCRGAPGRATRILRVLFRRARSRAESLGPGAFALALQPHHRVRATMARCSTGVPCAAVSRGRQAAQRALPRMATPFRAGRSPLEKPGPGSRTCWAGCPTSAKRGGLSLWLSFSLATQRESNSPSEGGRKLLLLELLVPNGVRASRAGALLQLLCPLARTPC